MYIIAVTAVDSDTILKRKEMYEMITIDKCNTRMSKQKGKEIKSGRVMSAHLNNELDNVTASQVFFVAYVYKLIRPQIQLLEFLLRFSNENSILCIHTLRVCVCAGV